MLDPAGSRFLLDKDVVAMMLVAMKHRTLRSLTRVLSDRIPGDEAAMTATEAVRVAPRPRRKSPTWAIIAVLSLCGTVVALQQTMVIPLLPDFPAILGVSPDDASWLVTATLLTAAVATPIMSRLADMFGKRLMMILCMVAMTAGSVVAALGHLFLTVIIGRSLQGFAAALIPIGISIMRDELPKEKVGSAVALMSATLGIGSALGLPLSGIIYENLGWQAIFWTSTGSGWP